MAASKKFTFWGYTLNNYNEAELVLVRNPPEFVREHVYTLEKGAEEGTPHVQGFLRLQKDQRMTYLKNYFLKRASWRPLPGDEYKENMRAYVQKQDETAASATHQVRNTDPLVYPAMIPELLVKEVYDVFEPFYDWSTGYLWWRDVDDTVKEMVNEEFVKLKRRESHWQELWREAPNPVRFEDGILEVFDPLPWEVALEVAKRRLVQRMRVETLLARPEVVAALRSFRFEILHRIIQNADQTHVSQEGSGSEEAESGTEVTIPTTHGESAEEYHDEHRSGSRELHRITP